MRAKDFFDLGYKDLVCVVPPDAPLAPGSSLAPSARGKVPGRKRLDGKWTGYPFLTAAPPDEAEIRRWDSWGANVGLRGEHFPGLDVDIDHPQLAEVVVRLAQEHLGLAPVRRSTGSRRLLLFRTDVPFPRMSCGILYKGTEHKVEVLGQGRQYLVGGRHPGGEDYRWEAPVPGPEALPVVDAEKITGFFLALRSALEGRAEVRISAESKATEAPPQEGLAAPSLERLEEVVAQIPNTYQNREDYLLFGYAVKAAGGEEARHVFEEWAARWEGGVNEPDTVRRDWDGMKAPFRVGWVWLLEQAAEHGYLSARVEFDADPEAIEIPSLAATEPGVIQFTDTWVVARLVQVLMARIRYVPETGCWHVWDGHSWERDRRNLAEHIVRLGLTQLSAEVMQRAAALKGEEQDAERKHLRKFAAGLQSRNALTKALPELQAHPKLTLTLDQFDKDPWLLNTPGWVVDLRTGEARKPDPSLLLSRSTAVPPRVGADGQVLPAVAPTWFAFLDEATGGDKELQRFLQKQVGYSLTASTQEQTLTFIHGPPLTGKSVFVEAIGGIFGSYHENAPMETFAASKSDRHPTDLAKLAGSRLVTSVETAEGRGWDTQRVKSLTGGDMISARFMRQDFFDFTPTFKIVIVGNHEPELKGVDPAMMRRLRIVPFEHHPAEVDRLLGSKLKEEWSGILSWAIEGCKLWLAEGLEPPAVVQARTQRYGREEDAMAAFLADACVLSAEESCTKQELFDTWASWAHAQGEDPGSLKQLTRRVRAHEALGGVTEVTLRRGRSSARGFRGIAPRPSGIQDPLIDGE